VVGEEREVVKDLGLVDLGGHFELGVIEPALINKI
jgi:hypothetical protein